MAIESRFTFAPVISDQTGSPLPLIGYIPAINTKFPLKELQSKVLATTVTIPTTRGVATRALVVAVAALGQWLYPRL